MAKLNNTSATVIAITFLVMNLSTWLRRFFVCVFMSSRPNNTCFEIGDKLRLYLKQIKAEKTYLKSSQRISMAPVFGLRSIIQQTPDSIPVKPGIHLFYPKVGFTKKKGFSRFNLVASGQRKYRGKEEDEPWYLLANLPDLKSALEV